MLWDFFKYMILPFIVIGAVLGVARVLIWEAIRIHEKRFKWAKILSTPDKFYEATIVVLVIAAIIYWILNGGTGVENEGF